MKTLKSHVILYDAACPMCNLYTKGFVKSGMLDCNGRLPYQNMPDNLACLVDLKRSVNEIALVNISSGKVYYGIESLTQIIGNSLPLLKPLFQSKHFTRITDKLYKLVSFNRRVIIPSKKDETYNTSLEPSFRKAYRTVYLFFTWLITAFILYSYSRRLSAILPQSNFYREFLVCGGQMIWQRLTIRFLNKEKTWDYLGNMMTISFAGGLLLLVVMAAGKLLHLQNTFFYAGSFGIIVSLMLLEHIRRTKLLGLGWRMTISWVLYRIVVLLIILIPAYYVK